MAWPSGSVIGADDPYSFEIPRPPTPALTINPGGFADEIKRLIASLRTQVGVVKPVSTVRVNPRTGRPETVAAVDNSLQRQAELVAAGLLDPQMAELNRLIAAKQQQELARGKAFEGVAAALSQYTAGIPEGIRSAYQGAADRTAGYASGLTGALGEAAQKSAAEAGATIAAIGPAGAGGAPVASEGGAIANTVN